MTNEELAKHWNVPLSEVESIADYMNKNYYLCVGQKKTDGLFYGLMYRVDEKHGPMLALSSKQGYKTPEAAADFFNKTCDRIELPNLKAKLMGVPVDAYKALRKIDTGTTVTKERNSVSPIGYGSRE